MRSDRFKRWTKGSEEMGMKRIKKKRRTSKVDVAWSHHGVMSLACRSRIPVTPECRDILMDVRILGVGDSRESRGESERTRANSAKLEQREMGYWA
jgi:hypothetical protein